MYLFILPIFPAIASLEVVVYVNKKMIVHKR